MALQLKQFIAEFNQWQVMSRRTIRNLREEVKNLAEALNEFQRSRESIKARAPCEIPPIDTDDADTCASDRLVSLKFEQVKFRGCERARKARKLQKLKKFNEN